MRILRITRVFYFLKNTYIFYNVFHLAYAHAQTVVCEQ